ncbi:MAG: DsrE family protein [Candidatus Thorarchaeota archaeon]
MIGDAVSCATAGQKTPDGYYNLARMIRALLAKNVTMKCCGTCLDTRGLSEDSLISAVEGGSMSDLAEWAAESDNVISF